MIKEFNELIGYKNTDHVLKLGKKYALNPIIWAKIKAGKETEYFIINEKETYIYGINGVAEIKDDTKDRLVYDNNYYKINLFWR